MAVVASLEAVASFDAPKEAPLLYGLFEQPHIATPIGSLSSTRHPDAARYVPAPNYYKRLVVACL